MKTATFRAKRCCTMHVQGDERSTLCEAETSFSICEAGDCDLTVRKVNPNAIVCTEDDPVTVRSPQLGTVTFTRVSDRDGYDTRQVDVRRQLGGSFSKEVSRASSRSATSDADFGDGFVSDHADVYVSSFLRVGNFGGGDDDDNDDGSSDDGGGDDTDDVDDGTNQRAVTCLRRTDLERRPAVGPAGPAAVVRRQCEEGTCMAWHRA